MKKLFQDAANPPFGPDVTIAIPCYNAQQWLRVAVESALAQDLPGGGEVSVWDDGSDDGSAAVARALESVARIGFGPNRGGNHARNLLLESARGKWIQFLDADDYLQPHKIRVQLEQAGKQEPDVIYSPVLEERWSDGHPLPLLKAPLDAGQDLFCQWFSWELPQTGAALWRREALRDLGGWNEQMPCCQEHELYMRAIQHGLRFCYTSTPGAVYRIWSEQTVCRKDPVQVILTRNKLFDQMIEWMRKRGLWREEHRRVAGRVCFEMARTWARHDIDAASSYFNKRRDEGLITMEGPAAPGHYRHLSRMLGFRRTESVARWVRGRRSRRGAKAGARERAESSAGSASPGAGTSLSSTK